MEKILCSVKFKTGAVLFTSPCLEILIKTNIFLNEVEGFEKYNKYTYTYS